MLKKVTKKCLSVLLMMTLMVTVLTSGGAVLADEVANVWMSGQAGVTAHAFSRFDDISGYTYESTTMNAGDNNKKFGPTTGVNHTVYIANATGNKIDVSYVNDSSNGLADGNRNEVFDVAVSNSNNRIVWSTTTSHNKPAELEETSAYTYQIKFRPYSGCDRIANQINFFSDASGTNANHANVFEFAKDGNIYYYPITGDYANAAGTVGSKTKLRAFEYDKWYTATVVISPVSTTELASYDMYINGEKLVDDMPLCNTNAGAGKVYQSSFAGIRGNTFNIAAGKSAWDDYTVFRTKTGSFSADATVKVVNDAGYGVDNANGVISKIPVNITVSAFKENVASNDSAAAAGAIKVLNADGTEASDEAVLTESMTVKSVAPNTVTDKLYTLEFKSAGTPAQIAWKNGNPADPSQNYATFSDWTDRTYYEATNNVNVFTGTTASANPSLKPYNGATGATVVATPVDDGSLGKPAGDRSIMLNASGLSDFRNRLVWGTTTSTGNTASEQSDTKAYVIESKIRVSEDVDITRFALNYYNSPVLAEGKTEPTSSNHHSLLWFQDGKVSYFPITGDPANGTGVITRTPVALCDYETNRWYTVTIVIESNMAGNSTTGENGETTVSYDYATYSVYLDGEKIVSDMPLCDALYNVQRNDIQQQCFFGIRGFHYITHSGTTAYDDYKIFRITDGSLSADATVNASAQSGYKVNNKANKIYNIPAGTTVEQLMSNITANDINVPYKSISIIDANGEIADDSAAVTEGMKLINISPNTVTTKIYELVTSDAIASFGNITYVNNGRETAFESLSAGTLSAELDVNITEDAPEAVDVFVAFYSDDKTLDDVTIRTIPLSGDLTKITSDVAEIAEDDTRAIKVFVWEKGSNRPLVK